MGIVPARASATVQQVVAVPVAFGVLIRSCTARWACGRLARRALVAAPRLLGAMAASALHRAPPAVRITLARGTHLLPARVAAITFPFHILFGIPIYFQLAQWLTGEEGGMEMVPLKLVTIVANRC